MKAIVIRLRLNESCKVNDKYVVSVDEKPFEVDNQEVEYAIAPDYPQQSDIEIVNKLIYKFRGNNIESILFRELEYVEKIENNKETDVEDTNKDNEREVL